MKDNRISENQPMFTAFLESELAYQILHYANTGILDKINTNLCQYLQIHKTLLNAQKGEVLIAQLIKYKICKAEDFVQTNPVDKMMELLNRPLTLPQNISELFTLHLIMFNYENIFQPELGNPDSEKQQIQQKRVEIHRQLRPNQPGEMFNREVRGRESQYSKLVSRDFGLFKSKERPSWSQDWHRYEFTPHKYRANANPNSPIVQAFDRASVPFIAGPSGTAADCLEGLHFLMPNMSENDKKEYLNFLAAAEIAQGHHSLHEILLVAMNANLFQNLKIENESSNKIWDQIDYAKTYSEFISDEFKKTNAYEMLALNYPQYFETANRKEREAALVLQKYIRAQKSYQELNTGTKWFHEDSPFRANPISHTEFSQVSRENVGKIEAELGTLTAEERNFIYSFCSQNLQLTHYTDDVGVEKIKSSGKILSTKNLQTKGILKTNTTPGDKLALGNHDFVFLRSEITHQAEKGSRFGEWQFIFDGRRLGLLQNGWISLFEQLYQSNFKELTFDGKTIRTFKSRDENSLTFEYPTGISEINLMSTVFYGPDIMKGIALCLIRELRRIGGEYQSYYLNSLDTESLNTVLSQLFRPEAKINSSLNLASSPYELKRADRVLIDEVAKGKIPNLDTLKFIKPSLTPTSWKELILKIDLKQVVKEPSDFFKLKSLLEPEMWSDFENSIDNAYLSQILLNSQNLTDNLLALKKFIPVQKLADYLDSLKQAILFKYLLSSANNFINLMPLVSKELAQAFFEQTDNLSLLELAKDTADFALFMSYIPKDRLNSLFNDLGTAIQKPVDFLKFKTLLPFDIWSNFTVDNQCIARALSNSNCKIDDLVYLKDILPVQKLTDYLDSVGQDLSILIKSSNDFIKLIPLLSPKLMQLFLEKIPHSDLLELAEQTKNILDFKPFMASISPDKKETIFRDIEKNIINLRKFKELQVKLPLALWSDFRNSVSNECINKLLSHSKDQISDLLILQKVLPSEKLTFFLDLKGRGIFKELLRSSHVVMHLVPLLSQDLARQFFDETSNRTLLELAKNSLNFEQFLTAIPLKRKKLFLKELGAAIHTPDDFFILQARLPADLWNNFKKSIDIACIARSLTTSSDWGQELVNLKRVIPPEILTGFINSMGQDVFKILLSSSYVFIHLVPLLSPKLAQLLFDNTSDLTLLELAKDAYSFEPFLACLPENRKETLFKDLGKAIQTPSDFLKFKKILPAKEWNNLENSIDNACITRALANSSDWVSDVVNLKKVLLPQKITLYLDSIGRGIYKELLSSSANFLNLVPCLSENLSQQFFDETTNADILKLVTTEELFDEFSCCIPDNKIDDFMAEYDSKTSFKHF